jgi:alpha-D-ribose 1-methylphosphonate 5-triphosphate synthase subunit PhnH
MLDLAVIGAGFSDGAAHAQLVFRQALAVLSRPGTVVECGVLEETPPGTQRAAIALLLALLDQDTWLWLSPGLSSSVADYLRFHTGCALAGAPRMADFALVASGAELPPLAAFDAGSAEYPDHSATVVVQVEQMRGQDGWRLSGPGVRDATALYVAGLGAEFPAEWRRNRARFPQGIDLYLACGAQLCGLPRTTLIEA